ncbi:DUF2061 domain-containing protein [Halosegnis longus]|uniref:DUF2061 domain-containing protein n=1 Tax=Halosegnis longus TaxID=2216012 RepID=UPI0009ACD78C|nr:MULTISPECIES: DUF2061 domain-containing protein [Halobacteriales]
MSLYKRLKQGIQNIWAQSPHQRMSRALIKTLLYRTLMVVITISVAFFFTGNTGDALSIGLVSNVIKTGTYYGYERLWDRVSWGVATTD